MRGRDYVVPQDVFDVTRDVFRHRLMLTYEALAKGLSADDIINRILTVVPAAPVGPDPRPVGDSAEHPQPVFEPGPYAGSPDQSAE
jgi:MoxR-like ATPase